MEKSVLLSAMVDVDVKAELEELARENHRTLSGEVRLAVSQHLALASASRRSSSRIGVPA